MQYCNIAMIIEKHYLQLRHSRFNVIKTLKLVSKFIHNNVNYNAKTYILNNITYY